MDPRLIDLLRADLDAAEYRDASVRALLGVEADDARLRGVFTPARRILAARGLGALGTLVRVFLLAESCTDSELNTALPDLGADGAERLGLLARAAGDTGSTDSTGELRAALSLNPVRIAEDPRLASPIDWWIISDLDDQLRRGPARPDHVMGVGGATRSLITQLPSEDQPRSLDLGTGCGIVALHLALRGPVVATDISARALEFAEANARLNRTAHGAMHSIDFRQGDLFGPLAGECFALIASNPPFVVTPRGDDGGARYEYRDGGMVGDALAERVVREAPRHLLEDGTLICLVNWESHWGSDGLERVRRWIATSAEQLPDSRLAAWVIERDRVSPERYAETWARDGGARVGDVAFEDLMQAWLDDFAARRITSLGLGSIRIRRLTDAGPGSQAGSESRILALRAEHAEGAYSAAAGSHLEAAFEAAIATARLSDHQVLSTRWIADSEVVEHREHRPGQEAPRALALSIDSGIARRVSADPLLAAAVGACDGDLDLGRIADALATLLELNPDEVAAALVEGVRELVWLGMLTPQADASPRTTSPRTTTA